MASINKSKHDQELPLEKKVYDSKSSPNTDSSISMTFESTSDCGYKSGDINVHTSTSISNLSISDSNLQSGKLDQSIYDSGLVSDCFSPVSTENLSIEKSKALVDSPCEIQDTKEKYLLEDIFSQDKDGDTILHLAIVEARSDIIFPLIRLAPHPDFLDITNDLYQTLLHLATLTGKSNIVRRLVVAGATLDMQDRSGNTPLHIACRRGDLDCVLAMLEPITKSEVEAAQCFYQIFLQEFDLSFLINMKNYDGQTCVHLAAAGGFFKVMECLYSHNADINDQDGKTGRPALHYAIESANFKLVELLLSKCHADPFVRNYAGQTSLGIAYAVRKRNPSATRQEIFELLKKSLDSCDYSSEFESDSSSDEVDLDEIFESVRNSISKK